MSIERDKLKEILCMFGKPLYVNACFSVSTFHEGWITYHIEVVCSSCDLFCGITQLASLCDKILNLRVFFTAKE
jgi:hypothetical protein